MQQVQAPPAFRSKVDTVPLEVSVVDAQGRPVRDLSARDFTVFEEGIPREILTFFSRSYTAPTTAVVPSGSMIPDRSSDVGPERTFLLVLGDGRIEGPAKGISGAIDFVNTHVLRADQVAVLAFDRITDFGTEHSEAANVLERILARHDGIAFDLREWRLRRFNEPIPAALQKRISDLLPEARTRPAGDILLAGGADGFTTTRDHPTAARRFSDLAARDGRAIGEMLLTGRTAPELKLLAGLEFLRARNGPRHLIWIGNGLRLRSADDDKRIAERAAHMGVTMHFIYTSGVTHPWEGFSIWDSSSARHISTATGGTSTGVSYANQALEKLTRQADQVYFIGYSPLELKWDGAFRQIDVKVSRPGVEAHFRRGYFATNALETPNAPDLIRASRIAAAAESREDLRGLVINATAVNSRDGRVAEVQLELDLTNLAGSALADVDVQVFCVNANGSEVGSIRQQLRIDLDRVLRESKGIVRRQISVPTSTRPRYAKIVAYHYDSDRTGTKQIQLR